MNDEDLPILSPEQELAVEAITQTLQSAEDALNAQELLVGLDQLLDILNQPEEDDLDTDDVDDDDEDVLDNFDEEEFPEDEEEHQIIAMNEVAAEVFNTVSVAMDNTAIPTATNTTFTQMIADQIISPVFAADPAVSMTPVGNSTITTTNAISKLFELPLFKDVDFSKTLRPPEIQHQRINNDVRSLLQSSFQLYHKIWERSFVSVSEALKSSLASANATAVTKALTEKLAAIPQETPLALSECHLFPGGLEVFKSFQKEHEVFSPTAYLTNYKFFKDLEIDYDIDDIVVLNLLYLGLLFPIGGNYKTAKAFLVLPFDRLPFGSFFDVYFEETPETVLNTDFDIYDKLEVPLTSSLSSEIISTALMKHFALIKKYDAHLNANFNLNFGDWISKFGKLIQSEVIVGAQITENYDPYTWS